MKSICIGIEQGNLEQLKEVQEILEGMGYESQRSWNNNRIKSRLFDRVVTYKSTGEYVIHNHGGKRPFGARDEHYTYEQFIELHKPKK